MLLSREVTCCSAVGKLSVREPEVPNAWDVWEGDVGRMGRNTSGTARGQGVGSKLREAASTERRVSGLVVVRSAAG